MGERGGAEARTPRHSASRGSHRLLTGFTWLLAAAAGFGLVFTQTFSAKWDSTVTTTDIDPLLGPDRPAPPPPPTDGSSGRALNILLIGSDDRSGGNAAIGGEEDGKRSDTTLIMHISADRSRIDVVSIPRDTMVNLSECQRSDGSTQKPYYGQFNEAYSNGLRTTDLESDGAACTMRTVEGITDIRFDHYAVIDFVGFVNMVEAVGGVPMCIPVEYADPYSGTYLQPGPQKLDGRQAVNYVRMRKGLNTNGGDLDRIDRQQEFLKNLASKVLSAEMLYRPQDITNFIKAVAGSLTLDEELGGLDYMAGLAFSLRSLNPSTDITFATAPVMDDPDHRFRLILTSKAPAVWDALRADQPIAPLLDAQSSSPANDDGVAPAAPTTGTPDATGGSQAATEQEILDACSVG
ncbi:LCP family protein [Demequina sp. TTPB684]|uniref:LCP family protein n=1 Tax=unclassified Demequina TaxID=2620311 RepID=UPI001CF2BD07|nr:MULTISPECIES: LCP family protein [unclassified Demequina]MCB2411542.1 LCP family protein [Demequina sp. TTPB684]UPU88544.1 LCP family protein [Demequina sp. TMPB413]